MRIGWLTIFFSGLFFVSNVFPQVGVPLDLTSIRADRWDIKLSPRDPIFYPGSGVDMSQNPLPYPSLISPFQDNSGFDQQKQKEAIQEKVNQFQIQGARVFAKSTNPLGGATENGSQGLTISSDYEANYTEQQEADALLANFRASYAFLGSLSAALSEVRQDNTSGKSVYFFFNMEGFTESFPDEYIKWAAADVTTLESNQKLITDQNLRIKTFVEKYGSHFVRQIKYGARIAIRAFIHSTSDSEQKSIAGRIEAGLGLLKAEGGVSSDLYQLTKSGQVSINVEVNCGGVSPSNQNVAFTSLDDVAGFFDQFKTGKVTLIPGPIEMFLSSYFATFTPGTTEFTDFAQVVTSPPPAPWGVPKGTVIAWSPPTDALVTQPDGKVKIVLPEGWVLCDGALPDVPDLSSRFILGTIDPVKVGKQVGSDKVQPTGSIGNGQHPAPQERNMPVVKDFSANTWIPNLTLDQISLPVPPSVYLFYIIRR